MEVTNEEPEQSSGLTQGDLAIAAYALAETFNSYLEQYDEEDFGELSKEQMESSMDSLRTAFSKFDAILKAMQPQTITPGEHNETMG